MPYSGDLNYFVFGDLRTHYQGSGLFGAGAEGWGVWSPSSVTLNYTIWTNTQIIINGFGGTYGQNYATVQIGDPILITIWATNDSSYTGPQTAWGGFIGTSRSSTQYSVNFTESGLPSGTLWSVTLNGSTETSITNTITFQEPNGSYSYTIGSINGYTASPSSGTIMLNGTNINQIINFT
ncbi:MAG: hypothetical protein ACP5TO_08350, partial [Thermoplasmata archaeon]